MILPRKVISWDHYFMFMCKMVSQRSKDPSTQVGSVVVNDDNFVVGMGYNGMPNGCPDDLMNWDRDQSKSDNKYLYVCHSEANALMFGDQSKIKGSRIYCTLFPCNECAKLIIQKGIREVIYLDDKYANLPSTRASKKMLDMAGIPVRRFTPVVKKLVLEI